MHETIKPKSRPPNFTPQQISEAIERAMLKVKYPDWYRLKRIENLLNVFEDEYEQPENICSRFTQGALPRKTA